MDSTSTESNTPNTLNTSNTPNTTPATTTSISDHELRQDAKQEPTPPTAGSKNTDIIGNLRRLHADELAWLAQHKPPVINASDDFFPKVRIGIETRNRLRRLNLCRRSARWSSSMCITFARIGGGVVGVYWFCPRVSARPRYQYGIDVGFVVSFRLARQDFDGLLCALRVLHPQRDPTLVYLYKYSFGLLFVPTMVAPVRRGIELRERRYVPITNLYRSVLKSYSQYIRRYSISYPMSKSKLAAMPSLSQSLLATRTAPSPEFSTSILPRFSSSARRLCMNAHPSLYKPHSKPPAELYKPSCHLRNLEWTRQFPNQDKSSKRP